MKKTLTILALILALNANATNWLTYYVYHETKYVQGPWTRTNLLEKSDYKYLAAQEYEELFGSEQIDLVYQILSHLKEKNPKVYSFDYTLSLRGDTVIFATADSVGQYETLKNELTASLTLNGFDVVVFRIGDTQESLSIDDLTLPYFDLVEGSKNSDLSSEQGKVKELKSKTSNDEQEDPLTIWLIGLGIINIGLIGLLVFRRRE